MTIYLYFPKLTNPTSFTSKQRSIIAGMWYCKGRFGERTYEKENDGVDWHFKLKKNPISSMIMREVVSAKDHLLEIQEIYIKLGIDPNLYNANYEIQMDYDTATGKFVLSGHRYPNQDNRATKYEGTSFDQLCWEYLCDLKKKYRKELKS
jgi:hypothetical protein